MKEALRVVNALHIFRLYRMRLMTGILSGSALILFTNCASTRSVYNSSTKPLAIKTAYFEKKEDKEKKAAEKEEILRVATILMMASILSHKGVEKAPEPAEKEKSASPAATSEVLAYGIFYAMLQKELAAARSQKPQGKILESRNNGNKKNISKPVDLIKALGHVPPEKRPQLSNESIERAAEEIQSAAPEEQQTIINAATAQAKKLLADSEIETRTGGRGRATEERPDLFIDEIRASRRASPAGL